MLPSRREIVPGAVRPRRAPRDQFKGGDGQDEGDPHEDDHPEDGLVGEHGVGDRLAPHGALVCGVHLECEEQHHGNDTPDGAEHQEEAAPQVGPLAPGHGTRVVRRSGPRPRSVRSGMKTRKVVDQPGVSTMSTKPSWASATDLAMASPRPVRAHLK